MQEIIKPPQNSFHILSTAWQKWAKKADSLLAPKALMAMRDLQPIIPYVGIFNKEGPEGVKFRILGEQLILLYNQDFRGAVTNSTSMTQENQMAVHKAIVRGFFNHSQGIIVERRVPGPAGFGEDDAKNDWLYTTLSLPMSDIDGIAKFVVQVGVMQAPEGTPAKAWKYVYGFDFDKTSIVRVQAVDIGCGVPTMDPVIFDGIQIDPPIMLTDI